MDSGTWIRKLREERFLKPTGLERLSRAIAEATGDSDFYISHGSLADIEAGGVPSIHKLFSLSCFLRISYDDLLHVFGVNLRDAAVRPAGGSERNCFDPYRPMGKPAVSLPIEILAAARTR